MKMSLVVPCYNEEEAIPIFYREALKVIEQLKDEFEFEFCFVDDGSKDGTLQCFKDLRAKDERVHYVSFSRNFGKESALYAGLQLSTGDYVATLDVDLQDPPSLIALLREELTGQGNRLSDLSLRECFIKSSIKCPQQKLWMVRETFG